MDVQITDGHTQLVPWAVYNKIQEAKACLRKHVLSFIRLLFEVRLVHGQDNKGTMLTIQWHGDVLYYHTTSNTVAIHCHMKCPR